MTVGADMGVFGPGGGPTRFDNYHTQGTRGGIKYPSPFFDIAHTYLPTSMKQMFRWCRYYFFTHPVINAVTYKMAEYPITPIVVDEPDELVRDKWTKIIETDLKLDSFRVEVGLDYYCYGNVFITIHFPFQKYLICQNCEAEEKVEKADYKFRNMHFELECKKCHVTGKAKVRDENIKSLKGIRLIRWNPENVTVEHNPLTGDTAYFFDIPQTVRNDVVMGKKHVIETTPHVFLKALQENKTLRMLDGSLFHFKRPTIAEKDMGLGMPSLLPVMKDAYYLQILRKAQEAIAQGYIVPLRVLFPQAGGSTSDPYTTTDLGTWRKRVEKELEKWRLDPNYQPIMPIPIGNEVIGGEAKSLMLHQEMRAWTEQIIGGLQVPIEFFFGGLSYSGSNMSLRMLENQFLKYRAEQLIMCRDFILGKIADYMGYPRPKIHFKRFKMADDLQRMGITIQLNQLQKVSDTTMLDEFDYDLSTEEKHKEAELTKQLDNQRKMQMAQAAIQNDTAELQAKGQIRIQKMMQDAGVPPPGGEPPIPPDILNGVAEQSAAGAGGGGSMQPQMGQEAAPGMPESASVYPENSGEVPNEGVPPDMVSAEMANQQQGGHNLMHLARRAATALEKLDPTTRQIELMKMRVNTQLYAMTQKLLEDGRGAQTNPLDPLQMPLPEFKPPRRQGLS
jgi:hypothetical protein